MKKHKYISLLFLLFLFACKDSSDESKLEVEQQLKIETSLEIDNLTINGNVENLRRGDTVFLYRYFGNDIQPYTSTTVHLEGSFQFQFEQNDGVVSGFYFLMLPDQPPVELLLSPIDEVINVTSQNGKIIVESNETNALNRLKMIVSQRDFSLDSVSNLLGSISRIDPEYYRKKDQMRLDVDNEIILYYPKFDAFYKQYPNTYTAQILMPLLRKSTRNDSEEMRNKFDNHHAYYHRFYFKGVDFNDEHLLTNPFFINEIKNYISQFRGEFKEDFYQSSDIILKDISNRENKEFLIDYMAYFYLNEGFPELANYISQTYLEGCEEDYIDQLKVSKGFNLGLSIGQKYHDFVLPNTENLGIPLSSVVEQNRLTILFIYKSTCEHCQKEIPVLKRTYELYKPLGLEVVGVSIDRDENSWHNFVRETEMPWMNLCDFKGASSRALENYGVRSTPTIYVIDKKGNIVVKNIEKNQLREFLELYLYKK